MKKSNNKSKLIESDVIAFSHYGSWVSIALVDVNDGQEYIIKIPKMDIMKIHDVLLDAYIQE